MHGFDELFGNLYVYHLNAEEEPQNPDYPPIGLVLALARSLDFFHRVAHGETRRRCARWKLFETLQPIRYDGSRRH